MWGGWGLQGGNSRSCEFNREFVPRWWRHEVDVVNIRVVVGKELFLGQSVHKLSGISYDKMSQPVKELVGMTFNSRVGHNMIPDFLRHVRNTLCSHMTCTPTILTDAVSTTWISPIFSKVFLQTTFTFIILFTVLRYLTIHLLDGSHVMWLEYIQEWWNFSYFGVEIGFSHSSWVWISFTKYNNGEFKNLVTGHIWACITMASNSSSSGHLWIQPH